MKIGIFGGTFNPPHLGHLRLVRTFCENLQLDRVLIIPNKRPTHKRYDSLTTDEERLFMCRKTFADEKFEISTMEMERETDSYTVLTLRELKALYPNDEFYTIIGSDMLLMFHKWYKYKEILENCTLCVASREDGDDLQALRSYAFRYLRIFIKEREGKHILLSPAAPMEVSSTEIRQKIENGESTEGLLADGVEEYIRDRGLYGYTEKR